MAFGEKNIQRQSGAPYAFRTTGIIFFGRHILPIPARLMARNLWENFRDWVGVFAFGLNLIVARTSVPKVLLYFGFAPGDDLLCTAVLRELRKRHRDGLLMVSNHAELFFGNDDPANVRPLWRRYYPDGSTVAICQRFARISGGQFTRLEYAPPDGADGRKVPSRHIIAEMCARAGVTGTVTLRPYLTLTDKEKSSAGWAADRIVIQSSARSARYPAQNKEWYPERFQRVVDVLHEEAEFIQLGSTEDPPLNNVTDLRGATTIREAASILHHARLYVGLEGFLMHLARAVECPSVIVFGGRVAPWQIGYICNFNLYSNVSCSPCWRSNNCDFNHKCMSDISVADVVSAIRQMMAKPRGPLAVETVNIISERPREASPVPSPRRGQRAATRHTSNSRIT